MWNVEYTDEFGEWFASLTEREQDAIDRCVGLLERMGPELGRPYVDSVKASRYSNMKELRSQAGGRPLRSFFVFDPRRTAILLVGGDKTGDGRFYERMISHADALYAMHLKQLRNEGLIP